MHPVTRYFRIIAWSEKFLFFDCLQMAVKNQKNRICVTERISVTGTSTCKRLMIGFFQEKSLRKKYTIFYSESKFEFSINFLILSLRILT